METALAIVGSFAVIGVAMWFAHRDMKALRRRVEEANKMTCRYCKRKSAENANECWSCGAKLMPNPVKYFIG